MRLSDGNARGGRWESWSLVVVLLVSCAGFAEPPQKTIGVHDATGAGGSAGKAKTLENLMTAYRNELNAQLQYAAYARKAEQEGYVSTACQFWATSYGEGTHARIVAKEIKRLGGKPKSGISIPVVRSTKENIEAAIRQESAEAEKTWPDFLHSAQEAVHDTTNYDGFDVRGQCPAGVKADPTVRTFLVLKTVDGSYANLFADQRKELESGKDVLESFLEPAGLKMRKDGIELLKRYDLD